MNHVPRPLLVAALCALALAACSRPPATQSADATRKAAPLPASSAAAAQLNAIAERYWDDYLALHPLTATALGDHRFDDRFGDYASPNWMADGLAVEQETLAKLSAIDPQQLTADERLTYQSLRASRELAAEGYRYPSELLAADPIANLPVRFAMLGTGQDAQPFRTAADYDRFLARMDGFVAWVDQSINDLRSGVAKGVVYPRTVVERMLPPLAGLAVAEPRQSLFWQPILNFPAGLSVADRKRLIAAYHAKLGTQVLPAYRRLHDYLQKEYRPQARAAPGMAALPSGDLWYAYLVRYYGGTQQSPDAVHQAGLDEVARLRAQAEQLMRQSGAAPDLRGFFAALGADPATHAATAADLLAAYAGTQERVRAALPLLFAAWPKTALVIRPMEPTRARYTGPADYRAPSVAGGEPGVLYVNTRAPETRPRYLVEAAFLREGLPGRHLQAALALENAQRPRVRRIGDEPAWSEGWVLYAQTLGRDLGLYADAASFAGYLMTDLWMSARVVVDTGVHAKGWSREQAVQYLRANSGLTDAAAEADVDLVLAAPGRLLAGKLGELKIRELRQRAQQRLGARFDIRDFHAQVTGGGSLPLPVLEAKIDRWITLSRK